MRQNYARGIGAVALIFVLTTASCSLFLSGDKDEKATVTSLGFSKTTLSLGIGSVEYLTLAIQPPEAKGNAHVEYTFDESLISVSGDASGATVTGRKTGNTVLIAKSGGHSAACVIGVSGIDPISENAPFISTTLPVVEMEAGTTKKVIVSLSRGSSAEMSQFNWSIDKSSIATVEASGQNGIISAKSNGVARISISHPASTYPLELLVFVKPDNEKAVYLTTTQNIISLARDGEDRKVSVSLINGNDVGQTNFTWEVLNNENSNPSAITLTSNGLNAEISPKADGRATIRVTHPQALYPLDIKVRVVTIIENVYIEPEATKVIVSGNIPSRISVNLKGSSKIQDTNPSEYQWTIEDSSFCEMSAYQNEAVLTGKKNGITKLTVTHPSAKYPREIMVFVENQIEGAVNTGAYITTSQNYIRTKKGMDETELLVTLVGGEPGDEKDFVWSVDKPDIISMRTTHGTTGFWGRAVSLATQRTNGTAFIEPLAEGTAVIYISHPKVLSPTEVLVKVYPTYASFEAPLVIQGQSIVGLVKGSTQNISLFLQGNVNTGDESSLSWISENTNIATVSGSGKEQLISAIGNGQTFINVTHPKAENPKKILCYVAETAEELDAMKLLYSEKTYYSIIAGKNENLYVATRNVLPEEITNIQWQTSNPTVATVIVGEKNTIGVVTGLSSGSAIISATLPGCEPVKFTITVYPAGTDLSVLPPSIYFTTGQNVVQFTTLNADKTVTVTPINLPIADYSSISWISDKPDIATIIPNGNTATITSKNKGEARITVSHPKSENSLTITVRIGEEYIIVNPKSPFISASKDVVGLVAGAQGEQISANLENGTANTLFTWEIDNSSIATISPLGDKCFIIPKNPGQAKLTIRHADATYDKNVLILVGNTIEDIQGLAFLTTAQNVVRLVSGTQQTVTVRLSGAEEGNASSFSWHADNPSALQIIDSGAYAVLSGMRSGISRVTVTHSSCPYPLELTVIISDTLVDAASNPYITSSQNILTVAKGGSAKTLSVSLAGGIESDNAHFGWTVDRGDLIQLTANGQNAVIKGLGVGECRLSVTHPKAQYPFPIVVIVEEPAPSSSLYINPSLPIVSMKPADASQTVTATLVGGTAEDKYGFIWSADNYNVIDITYAANTAVITPRQEGKSEITISHPKSPYDAKIIVRVTEYSQFAFSQSSMTIPEGTTQFVTMQVPSIEGDYTGRVTYQTDNPKIVTITGTNKVAQLTALGTGTAIVTATSPSGAKSDLMLYVKKAAEMTSPYITSGTNVLSMKVSDTQRSVSASIVGNGITTPDQYNLQWSVTDPSVASLIGTSGSNILVKPLKAGETSIQIKHPKTDTIYTIHVDVEGSVSGIVLNKTYIALETGKTQEITATIDNGTTEDYKNINWTTDKVNGAEIITILGRGKTVALFALASGQTTVTAEFNGKTAKCDVMVSASRQFSFDTQTMKVQPGQSKTFKYVLVPEDAAINWMTSTNDYITYSVDASSKTVTVTGISEGSNQGGAVTKLSGVANSMSSSITISCTWDYKFQLEKTAIIAEPRYDSNQPDKFIIPYTVNPANADISVQLTNDTIATYVIDKGKKQIILTPRGEGVSSLIVSAKNPFNNYTFGTQTCALNFNYKTLTFVPSVISKQGRFSRYDTASGTLILGDGEDVSFKVNIAESNANYTLSNMTFNNSGSFPVTLTKPSSDMWNIAHTNDFLEKEYLVTHDTYYTWNGSRISLNWQVKSYKDGHIYGANLGYKEIYPGFSAMNYLDMLNGTPREAIPSPELTYNKTPLTTPIRMKESLFKSNTDYYIPPLSYNYEAEEGHTYWVGIVPKWADAVWTSGNTSEYYLNDAQIVNSIDESVRSLVTAGFIEGTINRSSGTQKISIHVLVETRACSSK